MSFDPFSGPDEMSRPAENSPDLTAELDPTPVFGTTPELGESASTTELGRDPVSFIRESWFEPHQAGFRQDADTDRLPVIGTGHWIDRGEWVRRLTVGLAVLAIAVICGLGYLAVHNANVASKWHQRTISQVAVTQKLNDQLKRANVHITTLDGTVGSLQGRLATVTRQEKANSGFGGALKRLLWPFG